MADSCKICEKKFGRTEKEAVSCAQCPNKYHISCLGWSQESTKDASQQWLCPTCDEQNKPVTKADLNTLMSELRNIKLSQVQIQTSQQQLREEINQKYDDLKINLENCNTMLQTQGISITENSSAINVLQQEQSELSKCVADLGATFEIAKNRTASTSLSGYELTERLSRSRNVIVHGLKEDSAEQSTVDNLLNILKIKYNSLQLMRLGDKKENRERPLRIVLDTPQLAKEILRNKKKITTFEKFQHIRINDDRTPLQTQELENLRK